MTGINSHERVLVAIALVLFAGVILYNIHTLPPKSSEENGGEVIARYSENTTLSENFAKKADQSTERQTSTTAVNGKAQLVNINSASLSELMTLPGIGEIRAQAIVDYRLEHGLFTATSEIMNVSGIGEKTYEKLREKICV